MAQNSHKVKVGTEETFIIQNVGGMDNITIDKTKITLGSPSPFEESDVEFTVLDNGLYALKLRFDEIGEFLYRVTTSDDVILIKVIVLEALESDLVVALLREINNNVLAMQENEVEDDDRLDKILEYLKIINVRIIA